MKKKQATDDDTQPTDLKRDIVFYTVFFGTDRNWANLIPRRPSSKHPCYFFTNNLNTYNRILAQRTDANEREIWSPVFVDIPPKDDNVLSAFDAKHLKACPHLYEMCNEHKYICYFDSKHNVDEPRIEALCDFLESSDEVCVIMPEHPCNFNKVWEEYELAITVDKYAAEKDKYRSYIQKQLANNFSDTVKTHLTTQFILRKNNAVSKELNELWYSHIRECGIMCQLSFFFVQQIFAENIRAIKYQECYSYCF
jgi:hypothetical protein